MTYKAIAPVSDGHVAPQKFLKIERRWHPNGFPGPLETVELGHCRPEEMLARVLQHASENIYSIVFDTREAFFDYANMDGSDERAIAFHRVDGCTFDDEHIDAIFAAANGIRIPAEDHRADDEADGAG